MTCINIASVSTIAFGMAALAVDDNPSLGQALLAAAALSLLCTALAVWRHASRTHE